MISEKIIRRPIVEDLTGLSRSTIYSMIKDGTFPRPIRLGKRAVGWSEEAVISWIEERKNASTLPDNGEVVQSNPLAKIVN